MLFHVVGRKLICALLLATSVSLCPAYASSFETFNFGGLSTTAKAINDNGLIAGAYVDGEARYGFVRQPDGTLSSFAPPGTSPYVQSERINDPGLIAGTYFDENFNPHGFIRGTEGTISSFDVPNSSGTEINGLNDAGYVVGDTYIYLTGCQCAFVRSPKGKTKVFQIAHDSTYAVSINSNGQVAGYYQTPSLRAYIRNSDGTIVKFRAPDAGSADDSQGTFATQINSHGVVCGFYVDSNGVSHGFVRAATGEITEFDAPGAGSQSGQGTFATALSDKGEIVGDSVDSNNIYHGFIRTTRGKIRTFDAPGDGNSYTSALGVNKAGVVVGGYLDGGTQQGTAYIRLP